MGDELRDQLGRVLQVGGEEDRGLALRLEQRVVGRADVAEIARVEDGLEPRLARGEQAQLVLGAVGRGVINDDDLVGVAGEFRHRGLHARDEFLDVLGLVVGPGDDADKGHGE